ncbi:histidine phosphatase family protein [Carnobacterium divergens]|uniref:histidine phosphatase family protein n=1 Tax=Carnobacterium divergens TaxID=2748 RepID=UPI001072E8D0|nr:histidine phosphatase family protein [Carnobacterium divergens]TFI66903.1 histidine phosphatase family protein [Carnobacterium divergens]TFI67050.1 histidine phosphatase family protein [Carnobacterium divergens]TFI69971.1 histidine phosphatase family protein [Carnobacterium divergens]TFI81670.1 histidine phosphatase family protein [Carnobacterium divergens]TFI83283.1 histidine phosphatase family protein [Carnobacterium divergens]
MTTLYLVRHGQTLFNAQHKIQGFCDSPLTELGIKQAKMARAHLEKEGIQFDEAYTSTSERAIDTLELLTDLPYERIKDLREWNFGSYEGEGEHLNPPLPYNDYFVKFGGESQEEVEARISSTIKKIIEKSHAKNSLIVSHGAAIANFYRHWEHTSPVKKNVKIQNCSLFKYTYSDNQFILEDIIEHDFSSIL